MRQAQGPAANLIDWGYAVKRPLCEMVDGAFGIRATDVRSLTMFLDFCYVVRRPGFVAVDMLHVAVIRFWSPAS